MVKIREVVESAQGFWMGLLRNGITGDFQKYLDTPSPFRPSDLAHADRVRELAPGALRRADAMFAVDRAPHCATMF